jgi:ParB family chromosome partitioning protein
VVGGEAPASVEPELDSKTAEPRRTAPKPLPAPGVLELEELLSTYLDTRVKVEVVGRRGRVSVDFGDLEDLERIYRLMLGNQRPSDD